MTGHGIRTDTQDDRALFFEILHLVAKAAGSDRAAGGVVFWIKIEDHVFLSFEFLQGHVLAITGGKGEGRRFDISFEFRQTDSPYKEILR